MSQCNAELNLSLKGEKRKKQEEKRLNGLKNNDVGDDIQESKMNFTVEEASSTGFSSSSSLRRDGGRRLKRLHESIENNDTDHGLQYETIHLKGDMFLESPVKICSRTDADVLQHNSQVILSEKSHANEQKTQTPLENELLDHDLQRSDDISNLSVADIDHLEEGSVFEEENLESKGKKKNLDESVIKSSVSEELCCTSDIVVDDVSLNDEKIKTYKRKKCVSEVAASGSTGIKENLKESLLKSPAFENLCGISQIRDDSSTQKHDADMVVHDSSLKDAEIETCKKRKCQKLSRWDTNCWDRDTTPHVLNPSPERPLIGCSRRNLLILDVNGLLADVVPFVPEGLKADITIANKSVFKRPFCDEFLQFCFQKFDVGVWSSRTKHNLDRVVDFLLGDSKHHLLFCWDQFHCRDTGFTTPGYRSKPLFLKELRKLWEKHELDLPWEKGYYNESNTLLLDDSPYKALRNPPYTAIFPPPYRYDDNKDNSLGPGGSLRVYLEGLVMAENVPKYVEQNPFGQEAVTESHPYWRFFCKVRDDDDDDFHRYGRRSKSQSRYYY